MVSFPFFRTGRTAECRVQVGIRWKFKLIAAVIVVASGVSSNASAGEESNRGRKDSGGEHAGRMLARSAVSTEKESVADTLSPYRRGTWELSLESSYTFQDIPAPLFLFAGHVYTNPYTYQLATQILSVRYKFNDPAGPWLLRGTLEGSAAVVGSAIVRGPENYFVGFALGLRYYFVQPGARWVPYVEFRGGPGQVDSHGELRHAQQQDLAFTYLLGLGVRYDASRRWSYTLSVIDQHISNGYLTTPNFGFDSVGFDLGAAWRF